MEKLLVSNKNHSYVRIDCTPAVAQELSEAFCFYAHNYQYSPSFRAHKWDGRIRLFNKKTKTIYRGLVPELYNLAVDRKWEIIYNDEEYNTEISLTEAAKYIESLDIVLPKDKKIRDDQVMAFVHSIRDRRALLLSPTGSGKSVIIYMVLRYLLDHDTEKVLVVVPNIQLVKQLIDDFATYSGRNGWDAHKNCSMIFEGQDLNPKTPIVISTWQSIYELDKEWFEDFDAVVGDEVHGFKAKSLITIMTNLVNAKHRIGTTGTLDGLEVNELVLRGLFGDIRKIITTKELQDQGHLSDFFVKCLLLKHSPAVAQAVSKMTYAQEMEYLIFNEARNKFIRNLALSLDGNTLILYQYVDKHGRILHEMIKKVLDDNGSNRKIFFIYGGTDVEIREQVRFIVEKEKDAIIVASYGTFSTGINIRNLHNIIFASSSKSRIRNLQSIGRSLRTHDSKEKAILYDISDDMRHNGRDNYTYRHFFARIAIYNEERFKFKIYRIQLS